MGSKFKFNKYINIGAESAEDDKEYLSSCYIDTGMLDVLKNTNHPGRIVAGRTGTGKTALLIKLEESKENVVWIEPDELSLQYISNSTIINYLEKNNVNLDIFYKLLWKHVFVIELIKQKYDIKNESDQENFFKKIFGKYFNDKRKKEAFDYLNKWGEKFWESTEYRIKEVINKLENDIQAKSSASLKDLMTNTNFSGEASSRKKVTGEEKGEILYKAQQIVNSVQIKKLSKVIKTLADDEFSDRQKSYYIIIDRLDERWIDDSIRYKLIRALIEAIKDLKKINTAKIIISLRRDLIYTVFRKTRSPGFQEEKYQSLFINIEWSKYELLDVIDKRLAELVKHKYTTKKVTWSDFFPKGVNKIPIDNYLVERSLYRPRDIINFVNICIKRSSGRSTMLARDIKDAEAEYSELRFRAIGDEWIEDYPNLLNCLSFFLQKRKERFSLTEINKNFIEDFATEIISSTENSNCLIYQICQNVWDNSISFDDARRKFVIIFYMVGAIGIRKDNRGVSWSFKEDNILQSSEITGSERVEIAPMFFRVLGISPE
ncbi:MAG: hypothetical protein Q3M30_01890 [Candidatus Electrothrix sp. Rat3]|nr:hypothetical protein [Candidatus Electrothrix rattekaaiensis]